MPLIIWISLVDGMSKGGRPKFGRRGSGRRRRGRASGSGGCGMSRNSPRLCACVSCVALHAQIQDPQAHPHRRHHPGEGVIVIVMRKVVVVMVSISWLVVGGLPQGA